MPPPREGPRPASASNTPSFVSRLVNLDTHATGLRLRPNQRIPLGPAEDAVIYAIRSGVLLSRAALPECPTPFLGLHYSGDIVSTSSIPAFPERSLVAATQAEIWRLKSKTLAELMADDPQLALAYDHQRNLQCARAALHTTALGALDGHQRLAAFLIELARQIGTPVGAHISLDLPLSRVEIAQYLSLNADTLSRIMSRFKNEGLVGQTSRHKLILQDWKALIAHCPIADAILALHREKPATAVAQPHPRLGRID